MRLAFRATLAIAPASLWLAACANKPSTGFEPVDGAAAIHDASSTDAGIYDAPLFGSDVYFVVDCGAPSPACPPAPPEAGSPCQTAVDCEYGDDPQPSCNTIASCSASLGWQIFAPLPTGECPSALSPGCPGSYTTATALVASGAECDAGAPCVYAEGSCDCDQLIGEAPAWRCTHAGPACPSTRPRYGSACDAGGLLLSCGYGSGCYQPPTHVSLTVACLCGAWQGYPSCQFP